MQLKDQIEPIIRQAGAILMQHFGKTTNGRDKRWRGDVESDADLAAERCIVDGLKALFPNDAILTEEHPDYKKTANGRVWIIDSIDGSRLFLLGLPYFSISMALIEDDAAKYGMTFFPFFDELYWADKAGPAFRNGQVISVNQNSGLEHAMISVIAVSGIVEPAAISKIDSKLRRFRVWPMNPGGIVVPLCYVGSGKYDGAIILGASNWDVAASCLIIERAGGKVTDTEGKPWHWSSDPQNIVAANPALHEGIMKDVINQ